MLSLDHLTRNGMLLSTFLFVAFSLASFSPASALTATPPSWYSTPTQYVADNEHALISSTQAPACSVEPGSVEDVSEILLILGFTRTPFAMKGGGHIINPGFSSTSGIQISMTRFNSVELNNATGTVNAGPGVTWTQVYTALNSTGLNIIGGRSPTVGVAGLTLGGGYAFISKYGLTIDNMAGYELVLPNGTITNVTSSNEDLWFASDQLGLVKEALVKFQQKNDTKAALNVATSYTPGGVIPIAIVFYNAPTPAPGIFDDFFWRFRLIINNLALYPPPTARCHHRDPTLWPVMKHSAYLSGISVTQYSPSVFDTIVNQTLLWGRKLGGLDPNVALQLPWNHSTAACSLTVPTLRTRLTVPLSLPHGCLFHVQQRLDVTIAKSLRNYSDTVTATAIADGQNVSHASVYPNYALFDTPLEDIYGTNLHRLRAIKQAVDPKDVMGLARL
ncbi:FAD-binding domain-containing protein [Lactarius hengduanensis]|nr:FAD-binding domain-containing protein [Lactarius hengduanensis]